MISTVLLPHGPLTITDDDFFFTCTRNSAITLVALTTRLVGVTVACPEVEVTVIVAVVAKFVKVTTSFPSLHCGMIGLFVVIVHGEGEGEGVGVGVAVGLEDALGCGDGLGLTTGLGAGLGRVMPPVADSNAS